MAGRYTPRGKGYDGNPVERKDLPEFLPRSGMPEIPETLDAQGMGTRAPHHSSEGNYDPTDPTQAHLLTGGDPVIGDQVPEEDQRRAPWPDRTGLTL